MNLNHFSQRLITATVIAYSLSASPVWGQAPGAAAIPPVPSNLQPPPGHSMYLKATATGTQNYVCIPGAAGPVWKFLGPQATLFFTANIFGSSTLQQVATHFLSSNPQETDTARPTWQSSFDSSTVWGKAIASSVDPAYVAPGSIPWLLVEIVGAARVTAGMMLSKTSYIQRLKTNGGIAPAAGCTDSVYGKVALVPYTTDYYFYRQNSVN